VPLTKAALAILNAQPVRDGRDFVFGDGPRSNAQDSDHAPARGFQGWSKSKDALDEKTKGIQAWRLHDIRRTVATSMGDLGVHPHIIEAVLNHVSGHKAGVAGIYNRATYAAEKAAALTLWADHLETIINGGARKVLPTSLANSTRRRSLVWHGLADGLSHRIAATMLALAQFTSAMLPP